MYRATLSDNAPLEPPCGCFELECLLHFEKYGGHPDFRCEYYGEVALLRIDRINQDDRTGTFVCEECAEWLIDTGKFEKAPE